ncbi:hypothetical protein [Streptomyces sp. NPDC056061]
MAFLRHRVHEPHETGSALVAAPGTDEIREHRLSPRAAARGPQPYGGL